LTHCEKSVNSQIRKFVNWRLHSNDPRLLDCLDFSEVGEHDVGDRRGFVDDHNADGTRSVSAEGEIRDVHAVPAQDRRRLEHHPQLVVGQARFRIERSRRCGLVFGTYQYAKEGLDDPGLDTLFLATPKSDVEQPAGRILRIEEGKKTPLIVDFVDEETPPCAASAQKRRWQYGRLEFEVHDLRRETPAART